MFLYGITNVFPIDLLAQFLHLVRFLHDTPDLVFELPGSRISQSLPHSLSYCAYPLLNSTALLKAAHANDEYPHYVGVVLYLVV